MNGFSLGIVQKPLIREAKKLLVENRKGIEDMFKETLSGYELKAGEARIVSMVFTVPDGGVNYSIVAMNDSMQIVRVIETKALYELGIEIIDGALK